MKKIIFLLAALLGLVSCAQENFSKKALKEKLIDTQKNTVSFKDILKKHQSKVTVVEIWASWCGDCVGAMPKVKEMQKNNPNVDYVFISMDKTFDKWQAGIAKHNVTGDNYWVNDENGMKGSFGKAINLDWIPRYIIIDKAGNIATYRAIETEFEQINHTLKNLE